jgi:homoserine acetyltransferase
MGRYGCTRVGPLHPTLLHHPRHSPRNLSSTFRMVYQLGEAQRSSVYSDPNWKDGWYDEEHKPVAGLASARMCALLTYRSRDSFESRFGRKAQTDKRVRGRVGFQGGVMTHLRNC